jgi:DNA-binding GntR family transcriptional regulator
MNAESPSFGVSPGNTSASPDDRGERIKRSTVVDLVVKSLRDRIMAGELRAGEPVRQEALAEKLGVSRIPVREAINRLESEGFVTIIPHRGAFVTQMSDEEVTEAFNIRLRMEPWLLAKAIECISAQDIAHARRYLIPDMSHIPASDWGKLNWQFHEALYTAARQPLTLNIIQRLHELTDRYFRFQVSNLNIRQNSYDEHRMLVEAAEAGQVQYGVKLLENHIRLAAVQIRSVLPR